jgi:molybdate transport system ATP-binding protein
MLSVAVHKRRAGFALDARFDMPTPGVVALFGRSGSGKSTLVNIIAGLIDADSGSVRLDDEPLLDSGRGLNVPAERRRIGYVFQDARLFPHLRVAANLRYAERRAGGRRFIGFDEVVNLLGLGPLLDRRTHELSGGERQRTAIARALLTQPRLLLLDEPLASLDFERREDVLPYLEILRDRLAIPMVYVSHDFDEVLRLATHIVLMDQGRVAAQGDIGEMILRPELRAIIGPDAVGAILEGEVLGRDTAAGLLRVRVGSGELKLRAGAAEGRGRNAGASGAGVDAATLGYAGVTNADLGKDAIGIDTADVNSTATRVRIQILARDVIIATQPPQNLSVRNVLAGVITAVSDDGAEADLIAMDIGGMSLLARITKAATRELNLHAGMPAWALVKAVSLRGHCIAHGAAAGIS